MPAEFKKIAVLGGTGKAGKYVVKELIRRGYHVRALVRDPGKMDQLYPSLEVIRGDACDYDSVFNLVLQCDAVISTLGPSKKQPDTCSVAAGHIIKATNATNNLRYIEVAGLGINAPGDRKGLTTRILVSVMRLFAASVIDDRQKDYQLLKNSNIMWTIVRCPMIKLTDTSGEVKISLEDSPGHHISAADLARFLSDQVNSDQFIHKAPFVAN
jgi:putative NADH-flavin reductase